MPFARTPDVDRTATLATRSRSARPDRRRPLRRRRALGFDRMEGRALLSTLTVTNTLDSGPGSLRQAIVDAQDGDTIDFDASLRGRSIVLTGGELAIDRDITIDGPGA